MIISPYFRSFFLLLCLCICVGGHLSAQPKNTLLNDVVMPAPNAAALGKYGDIPVSYFTGVPNIDIPLYTVQEGTLELPISLSYHASGIKVGEMASWVGMGWSLNAGGIITRTVLGTPDDGGGAGYFDYGKDLVDPSLFADPTLNTQVQEITRGDRDGEPDLFSFNVGGYSGKFVFDKDQNYHFIPKADLKLEYRRSSGTSGYLTQFTIITPKGVRYTFGMLGGETPSNEGGLEFTYYDNQPGIAQVPTSWYLRKVETHDGKFSIALEYETEYYAYRNLGSCFMEWGGLQTFHCGPTTSELGAYTPVAHFKISGKRLTRIHSTTANVIFQADTARQDLDTYHPHPAAKRLDQIEIKNPVDSTCYYGFDFSYDYFHDPSDTRSENYRLKLNSIQETACDGSVAKPPYVFTYNSGTVPHRLSKGFDHWGFSNGASNYDRINIPELTVEYQGSEVSPPGFTAKRDSDENAMKNGVLEKITYPTGGHTEFTYEANRVSQAIEVDGRKLILPDVSNCNEPSSSCCSSTMGADTMVFTTTDLEGARYRAYLYNFNDHESNSNSAFKYCNGEPGGDPYAQPFIHVTIKKVGEIGIGAGMEFNLDTGIYPQEAYREMDNFLSTIASIEPGESYVISVEVLNGKGGFEIYKDTTYQVQEQEIVGGLRVKEIRTHDGISGENDIVKKYTYTANDSTNKSSGVLYFQPSYYGYQYSATQPQGIVGLTFYTYSVVPLGNFNGYHIGYERVVEEILSSGKTEYTYYSEPLDWNSDRSYPYTPDPFRVNDGKLVESTLKNENGKSLAVNQSFFNHDPYEVLPGYILRCYEYSYDIGGGNIENYLYWKEYQVRTAPFRYAVQIRTQDDVTTTTHNTYDNQNRHLAPTVTETSQSSGEVSKVLSTYVFDLEEGPLRDTLLNRNLISEPIEQQIEVAGVQVGGSKMEYSFYDASGFPDTGSSSGDPYPYRYYNYEMSWDSTGAVDIPDEDQSGDGWELAGTVDERYPVVGLPRKFTQTGWEPETYSWQNGLINARTYKDFTWSYDYLPGTRLLASMTNFDGQITYYSYDDLLRLDTVRSRAGNVVTSYAYKYQEGTGTHNHIKETTTFGDDPNDKSALKSLTTFQYLDGLGREIQKNRYKYGKNKRVGGLPDLEEDAITVTEYDNVGRASKQYEPFSTLYPTGDFYPGAYSSRPHTLTTYEASPLNRVTSVTPPEWHPTETTYGSNEEEITIGGLTYAVHTLYTQTVTDPGSNKTVTYTDTRGRTVMTRRIDSLDANPHDTRYLYDDKDRVKTVLPPGATLADEELIYRYVYDERDNVIAKKIPGQAWQRFWYDDRDLNTYMQDGNLAAQGQWLRTTYDPYGRPDTTGFVNQTPNYGNDEIAFAEELTRTEYDGDGDLIYRGKVSKTETRVLGASEFLEQTLTYDPYGRVTQTVGNNFLNIGDLSSEVVTTAYDFADNVVLIDRKHVADLASGEFTEALWRINAGGKDVNVGGVQFQADTFFVTSPDRRYRNDDIADILNTNWDDIYRTERNATRSNSNPFFKYEIPVPDSGEYKVNLHFAEIYWGAENGGPAPLASPQGVGDSPSAILAPGENGMEQLNLVTPPQAESGVLSGIVDSSWYTVNLENTYSSMVVVATVNIKNPAEWPAVPRIRYAEGNSFEVRLQNPSGQVIDPSFGQEFEVHYLVVEEGVYTEAEHGVKMEAVRFTSSATDHAGSWNPSLRPYQQSYSSPVILGQVMSTNDPNWSVFWASDGTRTNPPAATLAVGKHVGEDPNQTRNNETIGYVILEEGNGLIGQTPFTAGTGQMEGLENNPYGSGIGGNGGGHLTYPEVSILSMAGIADNDGCWPIHTHWAIEDLFSGGGLVEDYLQDGEGLHSTSNVAYLILGAETNEVPLVNAGQDASLVLPVTDYVPGATATDDGIPVSNLAYSWAVSSGSAAHVTFTNPSYLHSPVSISEAGVYTLRLIASDTEYADTSYVTLTVMREITAESGQLMVGDGWQTVSLENTYISPVVVATVNLQANFDKPAVTRVRHAALDSFQVRLQNPSDEALGKSYPVHYVVVEEGIYTQATHGIDMEAVKFTSTFTANDDNWSTEAQTYANTYTNPVVLGQVMTDLDTAWSVFWASNGGQYGIPTTTALGAGKHVARDPDENRLNETIGYIVLEAGSGTLDSIPYEAGVGPKTVRGPDNLTELATYSFSESAVPDAATVVLSSAGMSGGQGGWPALYGINPLSTDGFTLVVDEEQITTTERSHGEEKIAYIVFGGEGSSPVQQELKAEHGVLSVNDSWQTVTLEKTYVSPVVVATVNLPTQGDKPAVARVRQAEPNSFQIRLQNPSDETLEEYYTVHYIVVEEGTYNLAEHGVKMEAARTLSTETEHDENWKIQNLSYHQTYTDPIVLGQVMSVNDADWSVFWASDGTQNNIPSPAKLGVSKQVGEDDRTTRQDEIIGYLVFEAGTGLMDNIPFEAGLGPQTVQGVENDPVGGSYGFSSQDVPYAQTAIISSAAMTGANGGWPVLFGDEAIGTDSIRLAIDEDQIEDAERVHGAERLAYLVLGGDPPVASKRIFDVYLEGELVLSDFDIYDEVGPETALVKTFTDTVTDGSLTLFFVASEDLPKLSAIEVFKSEVVEAAIDTTHIYEEMHYDHSGRLERVYHKMNNGPLVQLSDLSYTLKDQIQRKKIGPSLQTLNYDYLPNGFLQSINEGTLSGNDLFALELKYDDPELNGIAPRFNGNIAQMSWQVQGRDKQTYGFAYDHLDRLQSAAYGDYSGGTPLQTGWYNTTYEYDKRGNIQKLTREGRYFDGTNWQVNTIDNLTYEYLAPAGQATNQLGYVAENAPAASKDYGFKQTVPTGNDYNYDDNGNLTSDPTKDIASISYNYLNLPEIISFADGREIAFTYDAAGVKLRKDVLGPGENTRQDYQGGIEFRNGILEAIYTGEGRAVPEGQAFRYEYTLTDHLGNARVMFTDRNNDGQIDITGDPATSDLLQEQHYYPFGMAMGGEWTQPLGNGNRYRYNGKELHEDFGLGWYSYGARYYDPALGRFTGVDPIADEFVALSPFNYASNDPVSNVDFHGLQGVKYYINAALEYLGVNFTGGSGTNLAEPRNVEEAKEIATRRAAVKEVESRLENVVSFQEAFIPGASALIKAHDEDYSGAALDVGLEALFVALPINGSVVKKLSGEGVDLLGKFVNKFSNQASHLDSKHISAAVGDILGNPITIGGKTYDHLDEVQNALGGLGRQLGKLNEAIEAGSFSGEALEAAQNLRSTLQRQKDQVTEVLNRAREKARNQ